MSNPTILVLYDPKGRLQVTREHLPMGTQFSMVHLTDTALSESELRDYLDGMMRQLFVVVPDEVGA